ncbi:hypothetical protein CHISP_0115 [Chitinispirillum alkaliphilum]|nr:hypothetical protein CHISP_0115 [Chitinispirillum alkaliphilum]
MKKMALVSLSVLSSLAFTTLAGEDRATTENKNVTIIQGRSTADGSSEITERILEECIIALPGVGDLDAQVDAETEFLREINGETGKNEFVTVYSASIDINYMLHQKVLIIVTSSTVQAQEPVMKVVERNLRQTVRFESNPANGDIFAGRSNRQHYFSTREGAVNDAKTRAAAWIKQQSAVVCAEK